MKAGHRRERKKGWMDYLHCNIAGFGKWKDKLQQGENSLPQQWDSIVKDPFVIRGNIGMGFKWLLHVALF